MAKQLRELARALEVLHNDRQALKLPQTGRPENRPENDLSDVKHMYGRHGDLKPENILFFENAGDNP
jgi:serine/threonine protein kinase